MPCLVHSSEGASARLLHASTWTGRHTHAYSGSTLLSANTDGALTPQHDATCRHRRTQAACRPTLTRRHASPHTDTPLQAHGLQAHSSPLLMPPAPPPPAPAHTHTCTATHARLRHTEACAPEVFGRAHAHHTAGVCTQGQRTATTHHTLVRATAPCSAGAHTRAAGRRCTRRDAHTGCTVCDDQHTHDTTLHVSSYPPSQAAAWSGQPSPPAATASSHDAPWPHWQLLRPATSRHCHATPHHRPHVAATHPRCCGTGALNDTQSRAPLAQLMPASSLQHCFTRWHWPRRAAVGPTCTHSQLCRLPQCVLSSPRGDDSRRQ
jgi:hypothetical protein